MTATRAALACFAAAAAWPTVVGLVSRALMSPLERAIADSWCGVPFHSASDFLGHCAACWSGSALLIAFGAWILVGQRQARTASFARG